MNASQFKSFGTLLALSLGACALSGCAEPLTYSKDFQRNGITQYNSGDYLDAAGSFKASARQDPTNYQTQYYLGRCYEQVGDDESAIEAYRLCLKLRPQMPAGRADVAMRERVLSRVSALIARSQSAETELNSLQAEAAASKSVEDYRIVARVFALRGDADSAIDSYRKGLECEDDNFILTKEFGLYLVKINQTTAAADILRKAWNLDSSDPQVAMALRGLGVSGAQLAVSSTTIEQSSPAPAASGSGWDAIVAPRD
jgi:Tfp pilus assembly protein PilF